MSDGAAPRIGITVLGMHRAGTSLLGQILGRLGCDPPRTLIGPSANNAGGYWESPAVVAFNDRLLMRAGTTWDDWQDVPPAALDQPALQAEAAALLAEEFGPSPLFVLKDPRICRLAPFWFARMEAAGITPRVILALRNPVAVAASLARRNVIEPQLAHLIWLRHMLAAEAATRGLTRVVTDYDALHGNWRGVMEGVAQRLGLHWPVDPGQAGTDPVDAALRHHQSAATDLLQEPGLPAGLAQCHAILHRWAAGGAAADETAADHAELDTIRAGLDRDAATFGPLVALGRKRATALQAAERRMAGLDAARAAAEAERDRLRQDHARLTAAMTRLERQVEAQAGPRQNSGQERNGMQDDVTAELRRMLDRAMADLRSQTEAQARLVADHAREMLARTAEVAQLSALLHRAETDLAETRAALTDTDAALRDTRAQRDAARRAAAQMADAAQIAQVLRKAGAEAALLPRRLRQTRLLRALRETGLFDPAFYLQANPDVAAGGTDPWRHYLHHGLAENRPPNPGPRGETEPVLPQGTDVVNAPPPSQDPQA